ncbi:hypothetical protein P7K49_029335 [Saguinus oedipus]|uniref:Uncharacterized protein n=1 Tax=Saguinus oedipus TaxID=9490 RepID=A0ABQ9U6W8_SAGOE|nr:hypothetical protein P7K49_029335 [Saguinus oedipus]
MLPSCRSAAHTLSTNLRSAPQPQPRPRPEAPPRRRTFRLAASRPALRTDFRAPDALTAPLSPDFRGPASAAPPVSGTFRELGRTVGLGRPPWRDDRRQPPQRTGGLPPP